MNKNGLNRKTLLLYGARESWTVHEAISLALKQDPKEYYKHRTFRLKNDYENLSTLIMNACKENKIIVLQGNFLRVHPDHVKICPLSFIKWLEHFEEYSGKKYPEEIKDLVYQYRGVPTYDMLMSENQRLKKGNLECENEKTGNAGNIDSHQKMILGMAEAKYGYDHSLPKNSATGTKKESIYDDLSKRDLTVSDTTIRENLKKAIDKHGEPGKRKTN